MSLNENQTFCEACGHQLTGTEPQCPFCGYRIKESAGSQPADKKPEPVLVPHAPEVSAIKVEGTDEAKTADAPEVIVPGDRAIQKPKGSSGRKLLYLFFFIIAAGIAAIAYLGFTGKIGYKQFAGNGSAALSGDSASVSGERFFLCYATAIIGNKRIVIISDVFARDTTIALRDELVSEFDVAAASSFPADHAAFKTVICKKYSNFDQAEKERRKLKDSFVKKGYRIREVLL
jgi:hypothetical protein